MSAPESVTIVLPDGALAGWPVLLNALKRARNETGLDLVFGGLIEQIERQTTPKPEEPTGWGAVVTDGEETWSRIDDDDSPWRTSNADWRSWDDLPDAGVRVLFEGVAR